MKGLTLVSGLVAAALAFALLAVACGGGGHSASPPSPSVSTATSSATSTAPSSASRSPSTTSNLALAVPAAGSGGFNYTQGSYLEGFEFTANSPISITELGAYDSNLSSLPGGSQTFATVPVAVYDITSHTLLGSVNVSASDPPTGVYRYAALSHPVTLNKTDMYAVAWVSLSNNYIASPTLVASDVNPAIKYLAMVGNGAGGLTTTSTMVEPNWFYTESANGLHALNYDLGPNFMFTTSALPATSTGTATTTTVPSSGQKVALGTNSPAQGDCTTNTSEEATSVGYVALTVTSSSFHAEIQLQNGLPNTTYEVFMQQVPGSCPQQTANGGTLTSDSTGHGSATATVPRATGATTFFVQLGAPGSGAATYTSGRISIAP